MSPVRTTNQLTSAGYDANGNLTQSGTLVYDASNRMLSDTSSGNTKYYGYSPDNKRIYRKLTNGSEEWTFYGARGEKLGTYVWGNRTDAVNGLVYDFHASASNVWFGGRLISDGNRTCSGSSCTQAVFQDRLGTNRANGARFYPYGEEIGGPTTNDREKFGTYNRDASTGFDYADQRYYDSVHGRFNTADQYQASAGPGDPGSWNRYSYVQGDPINMYDPPPDARKLAEKLKVLVRGGYTNCDAVADFAGIVADSGASALQMMKDFGELTPNQFGTATINTSAAPVYMYAGGDNGFKAQYQNTLPDSSNGNGDQGHHLAAFIQLGYQWGTAPGNLFAIDFEILEAGFSGTVNEGDIRLGQGAVAIGAGLHSGAISTSDVGGAIKALCDH